MCHSKGSFCFVTVALVLLFVSPVFQFLAQYAEGASAKPAILHVSLPAGEDRTGISDPDPWLNECWFLNITGASGTFTVRIEDVSGSIWSYDTHLVIALNDAAYNNLVSLVVDNITIVKNDFKYDTLRPYNLWNWPSGDVYPTWFNGTLVNVGTIPPKEHVNVTVSVAFSNATGAKIHFDAYGTKESPHTSLKRKRSITHNPLSEDSTVSFWPPPVVQNYLTVRTDPFGIVTIPGEGWYDNCTYVNLAAPDFVPNATGVNGQRYRFVYWDVDGAHISGNPINVHMDTNHVTTAHYILQYYLTVISLYGTPDGEGWYDNCTYAYAALDTSILDHGNETRRMFTNWSEDASGTDYTQSDAIHMDGPKTATANWKTQYLVTFNQTGLDNTASDTVVTVNGAPKNFGDMPYFMWADVDSSVTYNYNAIISSTDSGKRFRLENISGPSSPFIVTGPVTITGNYKIQYEVTFSQSGVGADFTGTVVTIDGTGYGVSDLPVSFWWDKNSQHNFSFSSPLVVDAEEKYVWIYTSGLSTSQSDTLTIISPGNVTGYYSTEAKYQIIFDQTGVGSDFNDTIIVIDGTPYNRTDLPVSFWWDENSNHNFSFPSPLVVTPNAKRYVWNSTSGLSTLQSDSITVSTSGSIIGNYKTQYYLTVISPYDTPSGEGWYYSSTDAYATLATGTVNHGNGTRRLFTHWSGDATGTTLTSNPIHMDGPKTATANWKTQYKLTVKTNPLGLSPSPTPPTNWYDESTSVTLTAQTVNGYTFTYWDVDGTSQGSGVNPITVHMNRPHVATANYQKTTPPQPPPAVGGYALPITLDPATSNSLIPQIGLASVLLAVIHVTIILARRAHRHRRPRSKCMDVIEDNYGKP